MVPCRNQGSSVTSTSEEEHHSPSTFRTLCIMCWSEKQLSLLNGSMDTKILYLENVLLAPICELVILYRLSSSTLYQRLRSSSRSSCMCYPMGVCSTCTRPCFICTHDSTCHVTSLPVSANVSLQSMPSFREKPHATNISLYPTDFFLGLYTTFQTSFFLNWYSPSLSSWLLLHSYKVLHQ